MIQHVFSEDYFEARDKFRAACRLEGLVPQAFENPSPAPDGRAVTTDVAWFGPRTASRLLVLVSGVHGVEALSGSAAQTGLIALGHLRAMPADTAVLMVHVINGYGATHLRRNTDGNVDLCRNFMDFSQPLPLRPEYDDLHAALSCPDFDGPQREAADAVQLAYMNQHGPEGYIQALMGGQYVHPDGFAYGGREPVWANRTLTAILTEHAQHARQVALVEFHTGLGSYAYGTAVTMQVDADLERTRRWFGEWVHAPNQRVAGGPKTYYRVFGHTTEGYRRCLPQAEMTSIVLEVGTYAPQVTLPVMLQDHWLQQHGDPASERGRAIRQQLLRLHYPRDPDWRQAVWDRSLQVVHQAWEGLSGLREAPAR